MSNIMIDIETLGLDYNSVVIQIAAVKFDWDGSIIEIFDRKLNHKEQLEKGCTVNQSTVDWWKKQNTEILKDILEKAEPTENVLRDFCSFISKRDIIWSSANFDIPILTHILSKYGMQTPWYYWDCKDVRTLSWMANINPKLDYAYSKEKTHNAVDDCKFQIKYCCDAMEILS